MRNNQINIFEAGKFVEHTITAKYENWDSYTIGIQ